MRYRVKNTKITVLSDETLVAGSAERHLVTFDFDESWDGYVKMATFRRGAVSFERILDNGTCEIPWEMLADAGILQISVRGEAESGTHPTAYAPFKHIYGAGAKGKTGTDLPTPDVWRQLLAAIGDITPYIGENGHWFVGKGDTGVPAQGEKGEPGDDYVLTDDDKDEIAQKVAPLTMVGKQLVLTSDMWVDDSDINLLMSGAPYKYVRVGYHTTVNGGGGAMLTSGAGITARNEWQTVNIEFTLAADAEAFALYFVGGPDTKYIQPYDIMDVKVYAADDTKKRNLFSDDIEEQSWATSSADTKRAIAMSDGVKYVHVFRQSHNTVKLYSTQQIPLAAGAYVFECKIRLSPWLYHCVAPFYDAHSEYSISIAPTRECASVYNEHGIYCAAFGNYSVTFACNAIPTSDVIVNAMIHKASGGAGMIFQ